MSSVTFSPSVGGDGSTVTDDSNATTGLDGGGHRTRFVPALAQVVAVAAHTVTKAGEASASALAAAGSASTAEDQVGLTTAAGAAQVALAAAHVATASSQATASATSASQAATSASQASASATTATTAANTAVAVVTGGTASLIASPGKIPIADAAGRLNVTWFSGMPGSAFINDIGTAGAAGFGVGICPQVPAGFTPLAGCTDPAHANYGNYQFSDGSIMCWIPAFRFRLGNAADPGFATYGANTIRIVRASLHPDEATANAEGYYLHRAFVNGGVAQPGFFRDKYDCSANGSVASSIQGVQPMVSGPVAGQVGFSAVGATNAYFGAITAARTRGSKFHPETVFQADALCRLSEAHAQAATSTAWCAWYDPSGVRNFPKGNDNNALKSEADVLQSGAGAVTFTSAGNATVPAFALAGSGSQLAKTTHNGQPCGVTDVAGNIYKINPGMTCVASTVAITGATQANPVQITATAHGRSTGDVVQITGVVGMTQINDRLFTATVIDANTLTLNGVDGSAFSPYTSGGTLTYAQFYTLKESVDIASVTTGATLATDHWGAPGVAAQFDALPTSFATAYPNNGLAQRYGNGSNAVFSLATAADRTRTMTGMPAAGGVSAAGSNAFGADMYYQYARDQLCVISRGSWGAGGNAGSRFRALHNARASADYAVGFAASCYL